MNEYEVVEVARIRTFERITVSGLHSTGKGEDSVVVNVMLCNGEYYCIDDPILLSNRDKVKVRVIGEVNDLNGLYEAYIKHNVRNTLNPYQLLFLYKEKRVMVPTEVRLILDRNILISNDLLVKLNEQLFKIEEEYRGKPAFISFVILDAIAELEEYIEEGRLTVEELLRIVKELVDTASSNKEYVQYPSPLGLVSYIKEFLAEEKEEEEREEERKHVEELRRELLKDVVARLYNLIIQRGERIGIAISEGKGKERGNSQVSEEVVDSNRLREELEKIAEEVIAYSGEDNEITRMQILFLLLNHKADKLEEVEKHIQKEVRRMINRLKRYGVTVISE